MDLVRILRFYKRPLPLHSIKRILEKVIYIANLKKKCNPLGLDIQELQYRTDTPTSNV